MGKLTVTGDRAEPQDLGKCKDLSGDLPLGCRLDGLLQLQPVPPVPERPGVRSTAPSRLI